MIRLLIYLFFFCPTLSAINVENRGFDGQYDHMDDFPNNQVINNIENDLNFIKELDKIGVDSIDIAIREIIKLKTIFNKLRKENIEIIFNDNSICENFLNLDYENPDLNFYFQHTFCPESSEIKLSTTKDALKLSDWIYSDNMAIRNKAGKNLFLVHTGRYLLKLLGTYWAIKVFSENLIGALTHSMVQEAPDTAFKLYSVFENFKNTLSIMDQKQLKKEYRNLANKYYEYSDQFFFWVIRYYDRIFTRSLDRDLCELLKIGTVDFLLEKECFRVKKKKVLIEELLFLKAANIILESLAGNSMSESDKLMGEKIYTLLSDYFRDRPGIIERNNYNRFVDYKLHNFYIEQEVIKSDKIAQELVKQEEKKISNKSKKSKKGKNRKKKKKPMADKNKNVASKAEVEVEYLIEEKLMIRMPPQLQILKTKKEKKIPNKPEWWHIYKNSLDKIKKRALEKNLTKQDAINTVKNYSNEINQLLKNIFLAYEGNNPLLNGESASEVMSLLVMGSLAQNVATPLSDVELCFMVKTLKEEYVSFISGYVDLLKKIGFILDKENLHPPILKKYNSKKLSGSIFTIFTVEQYEKYFNIVGNKTKSDPVFFEDIFAAESNIDYLIRDEFTMPNKKESCEGNNYIENYTYQQIENIVKNLMGPRRLAGSDELYHMLLEVRNSQLNIFEKQIKNSISIKHGNFIQNNRVEITKRVYRVAQLCELNKELIFSQGMSHKEREQFSSHLKNVKILAAFFRMKLAHGLQVDVSELNTEDAESLYTLNQILTGLKLD